MKQPGSLQPTIITQILCSNPPDSSSIAYLYTRVQFAVQRSLLRSTYPEVYRHGISGLYQVDQVCVQRFNGYRGQGSRFDTGLTNILPNNPDDEGLGPELAQELAIAKEQSDVTFYEETLLREAQRETRVQGLLELDRQDNSDLYSDDRLDQTSLPLPPFKYRNPYAGGHLQSTGSDWYDGGAYDLVSAGNKTPPVESTDNLSAKATSIKSSSDVINDGTPTTTMSRPCKLSSSSKSSSNASFFSKVRNVFKSTKDTKQA
jgi:hypothetical protein